MKGKAHQSYKAKDGKSFITAADINQNAIVEKALAENEEKYRTLFDRNRDSITIFRFNADGDPDNFIETNPATTEIFGYTKQELLSLNIKDLELAAYKVKKNRIETLKSKGNIDFET